MTEPNSSSRCTSKHGGATYMLDQGTIQLDIRKNIYRSNPETDHPERLWKLLPWRY